MNKLWYRQPAACWEEALPIGNGRMGAMIFGEKENEKLQLNEESMWYGAPMNRRNPDFKAYLPEVRRLLREGQIKRAEELMSVAMAGCPNSMHPYQTLGDLYLYFEKSKDFKNSKDYKKTDYSDKNTQMENYERGLDLEQAIATVQFSDGETVYHREIFASRPADCMVMRVTACGAGKVSLTARLDRSKQFDGVGRIETEAKEHGIMLWGNLGRGGEEFQILLTAQSVGGSVRTVGESLLVEEADTVYLYLRADTTYHYSAEEKDRYVEEYLRAHSTLVETPTTAAPAGEQQEAMALAAAPTTAAPAGEQQEAMALAAAPTTAAPAEEQQEKAVLAAALTTAAPAEERQSAAAFIPSALPEDWQQRSRFARQEYLYQQALQQLLLEKQLQKVRAAMARDYEELKQEHIADYRSLYGRVELSLEEQEPEAEAAPGAQAREAAANPSDKQTDSAAPLLSTQEALEEIAAGDMRAVTGLVKQLFDFGRYLLISCSREGDLPATLQGIWNRELFPAWDSKYTININTEMNYWPAECCNLSECHQPLFDLLKKLQRKGRHTARELYGCRGFVTHHNTDIHGDSEPQDLWLPATFWPMGAAWLCTHIWIHYEYTQDKEFLCEYLPIMAEAALFFIDYLTEEKGYLTTNPSVSPENSYRLPNGEVGACCIGATMDNQILRELFTACLSGWQELQPAESRETGAGAPAQSAANRENRAGAPAQAAANRETGAEPASSPSPSLLSRVRENFARIPDMPAPEELMAQLGEILKRLPPTRIDSKGRIMEWLEEYEEVEPGHRHISHLYGLYPADQITVDGTPELAAAAARTLEARLAHGGGHTGWSRAWIINHYAKLWDGEQAYANIVKMLQSSTYPNLFDKHPPFQIDGNFGVCAGIAQMLVQSNAERVVLLPALPHIWRKGFVKGLRLYGNATLDMSWENGELADFSILAGTERSFLVKYGTKTFTLKLRAGERYIYSKN